MTHLQNFPTASLKSMNLMGSRVFIYLKARANIVDSEELTSYGDTDLPWSIYVKNLY